jgi:serine/threonine protein kinase
MAAESKKLLKRCYGTASYVDIYEDCAVKVFIFDEMYWSREYTILRYLARFKHANILAPRSIQFTHEKHPVRDAANNPVPGVEWSRSYSAKITFPKYSGTAHTANLAYDVQFCQVLYDIAAALRLCHAKNIMHRDIKGSNILIGKIKGCVRAILCDFTHAIKLKQGVEMLDTEVCTYSHRAPEVFAYISNEANPYGFSCDIWSLGIVAFEKLTNINILDCTAETERDVKQFWIEHGMEDLIEQTQATIDQRKLTLNHADQYVAWVLRMTDKNPATRITAAELLEEITEYTRKHNIVIQTTACLECEDVAVDTIQPLSIEKKELVEDLNKKIDIISHIFTECPETIAEVRGIMRALVAADYFDGSICVHHAISASFVLAVSMNEDTPIFPRNYEAALTIALPDFKYEKLCNNIIDICCNYGDPLIYSNLL